MLRPSVPLPVPVFAVTVHVVPEPVVEVIDGAVRPPLTSAKLPFATPVTDSLNVTVQETLVAFVGDAPARVIVTVGCTESYVREMTLEAVFGWPPLVNWLALTWQEKVPCAIGLSVQE